MSIDSVTEMWSRQTGGVSSPDGKKYSASFASAYQVVHSAGATTAEIIDAVPVKLNDAYPSFSGVYCDKVGDRQPSGPILSIVPVTYSGEVGPRGEESPLNLDPEIEYHSATASEPADTDGNGVPYCNVNGELVDGINRDISDMVLTVRRNFAAINATVALQYLNSVNSDVYAVLGDTWQPGQAALQDFKINPVIVQGSVGYFNVSARVIFRLPYNTVNERAWWGRYRNEGLYERVGTRATFGVPGGTGKQAYGYPIVSAGAVSAIAVTCAGSGYASAPTVTITDATGSGATATASISGGRVVSVSIGAGGSGYKTSLLRAVDESGESVTQPVLLKADGTRERNSDAAVWLERPKKTYTLPYSVLGLI
jgi:hypothetical protein